MKKLAVESVCYLQSPVGTLQLIASAEGLNRIDIVKGRLRAKSRTSHRNPRAEKILNQAACELREYFAGERKRFTIPLDPAGTPFQTRVWNALKSIPYGKTVSYKDIAARIGNEKAVRAVGGANSKNPVCIVIPCHRVIASDGSIGGYSGGLKMKNILLGLELTESRAKSR